VSLVAAVLPAAALGVLRTRSLLLMLSLAAITLGVGRGAAAIHVPGPGSLDAYVGRHVTLTGTVVRSSGGAAFQSLWVNDLAGAGPGRLRGTAQVTARATSTVVPGSLVRVTGTVERLPGRAFDGSSGYDDRMEREGVLGAIPGAGVQVLRPPGWSLPTLAWRLRQSMAGAVRTQIPEPEATILLGELVGIRGKLPPAVEADLVASGLVHLLAVSGLKVALLAGILAGLLRQAGRRAALLAIVGILAYALVGGGSSAALRSAIMGSLGLVAQVLRRDIDPVRTLLLAAATMLGAYPALGGDLSFQYSFLGVAGIQLLRDPIDRRLGAVPRPFREALSVSVAAQLATLPLTAAYFHVVSAAGPLANTLAIPLLPPSLAAAAWVAAGLPSPAGLVATAAAGSAHGLVVLAAAAAALPLGAVQVPWFGVPHALSYYAAAILLVAAHRLGRLGTSAAVGAVVVTLAVSCWTSLPDGRMHLALLATPGGGALVTAPDGARMLVDAGASATALAGALDAQLAPPDPGLDAVVLTGSAPGAVAGSGGLGTRLPGLLLVPADSPGDMPGALADAFMAHGTTVEAIAPGDRLRWHGLDILVGGCGEGLSLEVLLGRTTAWFCASGTVADPGALPNAGATVVDLGAGRAQPDGSIDRSAWVVEHTAGSARGAVSAATLGNRLWRTSKDGPLVLACDSTSCAR
jgi:competence protein ComEC